MFSDKFVNKKPSRLEYRHYCVGTDHQKQNGGSSLSYSALINDHEHHSLPTMVSIVSTKSESSSRPKMRLNNHTPTIVNSLSRNLRMNQPLLQKRCSAQRKKLSLTTSANCNPKVLCDEPPQFCFSTFQSKQPAAEDISKRLRRVQIGAVDTKIASASPSTLSVSRKLKDCRRSLSVDIEPSISFAQQHTPFVIDQFKVPGSQQRYLQQPSKKVDYKRTSNSDGQKCRNSWQSNNQSGLAPDCYEDCSSDVTSCEFSHGEEDIEGSFMERYSTDCSSDDESQSLYNSFQSSSFDNASTEDTDEREEFDELFLLEVKRRRERDFGLDTSGAHMSDIGGGLIYDRMCTGSDKESDHHSSAIMTNALKKRDEITQDQAEVAATVEQMVKPSPSSWMTYGLSQCTVPVASSLLNLPGNSELKPSNPLTPSLFPEYFTPTLHFPLHDENYLPLPKEKQALLKWKVSSITPNIVKNCSARVGFTRCARGNMWMGYWGKHMKAESFKLVKEYQKINHFPGTFQIGRKDRLWRNLNRLQSRVGKKNCNFVPQTYVLPQDLSLLRKDWEEGGKLKWILKPPASARGIGIKVVNKWKDVPKKKPVVVQRYIANPYLINGMKFDLRVYVYVSSYEPLKIYVFREGLARFATCKYSSAMKHISNRFMHLTNYSINKHNTDFTPNTDETVCQGHKWGLLALWRYMSLELGVDTQIVWEAIKDVVIKTIISSEQYVSSNVKAYVRHSSSVYELFGFDIMLDHNLKPWILEVNISPSLHSNSQLDVNIKGRLVRDLFNMCGFKLYSKQVLCGNESLPRHPYLTPDERSKHSYFIQRSLRKDDRRRVLDHLTADDVRTLMAAEDEFSRCGYFERVFPSSKSDQLYRKFFETEKYYNVLLGEWAEKYEGCHKKGIKLLKKIASDLKLQATT